MLCYAMSVTGAAPSLIKCEKLTVEGKVKMEAGVVFQGKVKVSLPGSFRSRGQQRLAPRRIAHRSRECPTPRAPMLPRASRQEVVHGMASHHIASHSIAWHIMCYAMADCGRRGG